MYITGERTGKSKMFVFGVQFIAGVHVCTGFRNELFTLRMSHPAYWYSHGMYECMLPGKISCKTCRGEWRKAKNDPYPTVHVERA